MTFKTMIIEDDEETRTAIHEHLAEEQFAIVAPPAPDRVVQTVIDEEVHICPLGVRYHGFDGYDLARDLRHKTGAGIIMLGHSDDEVDVVMALEMGADDYVKKPVRPRELCARMRTVLRRTAVTPANDAGARPLPDRYLRRIGDLEICSVLRSVRVAGWPVDLTPLEFDLLSVLAAQTNVVLSRDKIIASLRGASWAGSDRSVDQIVSRLRTKLFGGDVEHQRIRTVHGRGYMLIETPLPDEA